MKAAKVAPSWLQDKQLKKIGAKRLRRANEAAPSPVPQADAFRGAPFLKQNAMMNYGTKTAARV